MIMMAKGVRKMPEVESLDTFFSGDADQLRANYQYALQVMDEHEGQPLSAAAAAAGADQRGPANTGDADHFLEHWLSENGDFAGQPIGDIFRHGYTEAIHLAETHDPPFPIESHWVTGTEATFQIHVSDGPRQVNVFVLVPPTASGPTSGVHTGGFVVRAAHPSDSGAESLGGPDSRVVKVPVHGPDAAA